MKRSPRRSFSRTTVLMLTIGAEKLYGLGRQKPDLNELLERCLRP